MAEQIVNLPATPERAKSSPSSNGGKGVPHYLRPSTGSCHDHCKHGIDHNFLTKPKLPVRKKVVPAALDDEVDILVLVDKKMKKPVLEEPKPPSDRETLIAKPTKIVKLVKKATDKLRASSSGSKTILPESTKVSRREKIGTAKVLPSPDSKTLPEESTEVIRSGKKGTVKVLASPDSKTLPDVITKVIKREKKATAAKAMPSSGVRIPAAMHKATSSSEPTKLVRPKTSSASIVLGDPSKRLASKPIEKSPSAKVLSSSSPTPIRVKLLSSPSSSNLRRNSIASSNGKELDDLKSRSSSSKPIRVKLLSSPSSSNLRRNSIAASNGKELDVLKSRSSSSKPIRVKLLSSPSSSNLRRNSIASSNGKERDVLKSRAAYVPKSATFASSSSSSGGRVSEVKTSIPQITAKKILATPKASLSPKISVSRIPSLSARNTKSLKTVSPVKNQNRLKRSESKQQSISESIPEKTLHVIKMEPVSKTSIPTDTKSVLVDESSHHEIRVSDTFESAENGTLLSSSSLPSSMLAEIETPETYKSNSVPLAELPPSSSLLSLETAPLSSLPSLSLSMESVIEKSDAEIEIREIDKTDVPLAESPPPSSSLVSPESPPLSSPPSVSLSMDSVIEKNGAEIETLETDKNNFPLAESPLSSMLVSPESPPLSSPPSVPLSIESSPLSLSLSVESVTENSFAEKAVVEPSHPSLILSPGSLRGLVSQSPPSSPLLSPESPPLSSPPSLSLSVESVPEKSFAEKETIETDQNEKAVMELSDPSFLLSPGSSSGPVSQSLSSNCDEEEEEEDLDGSEYTDSEHREEHEKGTHEEKNNARNAKGKMALSEDKHGNTNPVKLNFRRGKVVDPQQSQGNSPRKLRFKQGRVLGDNENGDAQKRSYKKRETERKGDNSANLGSEKVVLKHQELQEGKKDLQGLFNNVIEQTMNKLTGTRRSKVGALVGAFETVISLQDSKKSPSHHLAG